MNILVTGSGGQLGHALRRASAASADRYFFTDVAGDDTLRLDITDREAVKRFVREHAIGAVVNCAAYTDVERAEDDAERAELLNATAAGHLARAMKGVGGLLVHVSTDYVFDGTANKPCTEETPTAPRSVYGATKLHGEEEVLASGCRYVILRTAWLYSEIGRNFLRTMLRLTEEKEVLRVVFDQTGTPTYAGDLAEAIFDIVEHRKYEGREGIYHFSDEGVCSWYDFARAIAEYAGNSACDIRPCHSDEFPSKAVRPAYSVLDKTKIKETFGIVIPHWTDSLRKCIGNIEKEK